VLSAFPKTGDEWMTARFSGDTSLWMSGWNRALRSTTMAPVVDGWNRFSPQTAGAFNSGPLLVAGSRDGKWLALTADAPQLGNDRVDLVSVPSMKTTRLAQPSPYSAAISSDGRWVATGSYTENGVKIWALPSGTLHRTIEYPGLALSLSFSGDSTGLWISGRQGLRRFSTKDWTLSTGRPIGIALDSTAISPVEDYIASITRNEILLHRCADLTEVARIQIPGWAGRIGSATLAFSNDGRQLALHAALGAVIIWDIPALREELAALGMSW
jgi:WD40 repeat protein